MEGAKDRTAYPLLLWERVRVRVKKRMALNLFSAPFLFEQGQEIPTQTFSFSVRMRPELDDRA
ncbi:hypothetical protein ABW09_12415 [Pluralibacter gergoviae]|nr:hypothetical protein ABW09_12415 [Pluralibacter gergoviae]